jgi:hypothetical protein
MTVCDEPSITPENRGICAQLTERSAKTCGDALPLSILDTGITRMGFEPTCSAATMLHQVDQAPEHCEVQQWQVDEEAQRSRRSERDVAHESNRERLIDPNTIATVAPSIIWW